MKSIARCALSAMLLCLSGCAGAPVPVVNNCPGWVDQSGKPPIVAPEAWPRPLQEWVEGYATKFDENCAARAGR